MCDLSHAKPFDWGSPEILDMGDVSCWCDSSLKSSISNMVWNFPALPVHVQMLSPAQSAKLKHAVNNGNISLPTIFKDSKEIHKTACFLSRKREICLFWQTISSPNTYHKSVTVSLTQIQIPQTKTVLFAIPHVLSLSASSPQSGRVKACLPWPHCISRNLFKLLLKL